MLANQLGRRNLTKDDFTLLLGRRYNAQKKQGERTDITSPQNGDKLKTSQKTISRPHFEDLLCPLRALASARYTACSQKQAEETNRHTTKRGQNDPARTGFADFVEVGMQAIKMS